MQKTIKNSFKTGLVALSIAGLSLSGNAQAHAPVYDYFPYYFLFYDLEYRPHHHHHYPGKRLIKKHHKKHHHKHKRKHHSHDRYSDYKPRKHKHHGHRHDHKRKHKQRNHEHGGQYLRKYRDDD